MHEAVNSKGVNLAGVSHSSLTQVVHVQREGEISLYAFGRAKFNCRCQVTAATVRVPVLCMEIWLGKTRESKALSSGGRLPRVL